MIKVEKDLVECLADFLDESLTLGLKVGLLRTSGSAHDDNSRWWIMVAGGTVPRDKDWAIGM